MVCHITPASEKRALGVPSVPASMKVRSRWIDEMPMMAMASLTLRTLALTWLSHVNASVLKVKLATAIIGISSIHLLKTFINAANYDIKVLMWQTIIHALFILSALGIALVDRLSTPSHAKH